MARRPSRSTSKADVGQLLDFEHKLELAARTVDEMAEDWQQDWGEEWADGMRQRALAMEGPGDPVHLHDQIRQVEPGGITMGRAFWWLFLEYGTVDMPPHPFINPAMKKVRTPARKDASERAIDLIHKGKTQGSA